MSDDRLDRTLSEDPKMVLWLNDSDAYHEQTREEPPKTDCGLVLDPDRGDFNNASESLAIEAGHRRCKECGFDEPEAVYLAGAKRYHRPVDTGQYEASACGEVNGVGSRPEVLRRGVACLEHNGVEPCPDCWDTSTDPPSEPEPGPGDGSGGVPGLHDEPDVEVHTGGTEPEPTDDEDDIQL